MAVVAASGGEEEAFAGLQPSTCALNGNSDHALQISSILYQDKKPWGRVNMPESENYVRDETAQDRLEHSDDCIITVRLDPDTERGNSETLCQTVAVYSREAVPQLSWTADRAWWLRLHSLLLVCGRLRMLMAWYSTLGGAHSSLGEEFATHAKQAGVISQQQLVLAGEMGDPLMAVRCKLYAAFSLLQRGKGRQAARIIRKQYQFITKEAVVRDPKLISMCQAAWVRLKHLKDIEALKKSSQQHQEVKIQEER